MGNEFPDSIFPVIFILSFMRQTRNMIWAGSGNIEDVYVCYLCTQRLFVRLFIGSPQFRGIERFSGANKTYMGIHKIFTCTRARKGLDMTGKRKKTILRTIRLSEEIDTLLEQDAQKQNISTNALVGKIMTRYVEWDRVVEKLDFVSFSNAFFVALINEVSDEKFQEIASQEAIRQMKNQAMWDFGKTDFDTLLNTILLIGKYGTASDISVERWGEGNYVITLHHKWGHKGVVFFRSFFDNLIRSELGVQPRIDIADNVIAVSFQKPLKRTS